MEQKNNSSLKLMSIALKYYARKDIQEAIVRESEDREVGIMITEGKFLKRPEILTTPYEIYEFAKKRAISFHFSEELWKNPLEINKTNLNELRKGWDLILDVDGINYEMSKIATKWYMKLLDSYEVPYSIKYSGNKGFHLGIAFEEIPKEIHDNKIEKLFPEAPRKVAKFIEKRVEKKIGNDIQKQYDINELCKMSKKSFNQIVLDGKIKVSELISLDTQLVSSRHLFRAPYSLSEKSGLASIPLRKSQFAKFERDFAKPELVDPELWFIKRKKIKTDAAKNLIIEAYDFNYDDTKKIRTRYKTFKELKIINPKLSEKIKEKIKFYEPPCIKNLKNGLKDGRKRALFIYINYLHGLNYSNEEIEKRIYDWNKKNSEPLREAYVKGQLRYFLRKEPIMPPNCDKDGFYKDINICKPNNLCERIKNPLNYTKRLMIREMRFRETQKHNSNNNKDINANSKPKQKDKKK